MPVKFSLKKPPNFNGLNFSNDRRKWGLNVKGAPKSLYVRKMNADVMVILCQEYTKHCPVLSVCKSQW